MTDDQDFYGSGEKTDGENELSSGEGFSKDELSQIEQTGTITSAKGRHIIHLGGKYGSYLQVPVVPEK